MGQGKTDNRQPIDRFGGRLSVFRLAMS